MIRWLKGLWCGVFGHKFDKLRAVNDGSQGPTICRGCSRCFVWRLEHIHWMVERQWVAMSVYAKDDSYPIAKLVEYWDAEIPESEKMAADGWRRW